MKLLVIISAFIATVYSSTPILLTPTIITAQSPILSQYHSQDTLGQYSYGYNGGLSAKIESKSLDGVTRGSYSYLDADNRLQTVEYTADPINGFRAAATNLPKAPTDRSEPVRETPEVTKARNEHIRALEEAIARATADLVKTTNENDKTKKNKDKTANNNNNRGSRLLNVDTNTNDREIFSYTINTNDDAWRTNEDLKNTPTIGFEFTNTGPRDTPEVTMARLEHFKAVEEQKARIAAARQ